MDTQPRMSYTFIHKKKTGEEGVVRKKKKGLSLSGRMGNPGDIFFCVALSLWGQMPAGLPPHCLSVCVSLFPLHTVIRRILMERGFISV